MTDTQGGEAATVETTPQAAVEAAVSSQESKTQERDYEAEAAEMGWRPKEEWTGKPENWKSAKVYVEHGEVNARIAKIEKDYADRFDKLEKATSRSVERMKAQHAKEIDALKAQKREAVKAGDADAVDRIDEELDRLKADGPETVKRTDEQVQAEWVKKNPWYDEDEDLQIAAIGYSNRIKSPDLSFEDNLAKVEAYIRKKFPEKFEDKKTAANGHAAVDGGGSMSGIINRSATEFSKLPSEAKRQFERDVENGLYKDNAGDREAWAKAYNS